MKPQLAEATRRALPDPNDPLYFQARVIAAGPPVAAPPPEPGVHPLIRKIGTAPAVKAAIAEAEKAQADFEREYKGLLPILDFQRHRNASLNRVGSARSAGELIKAVEDVAAMTPEQFRAAQYAAKATIAQHSARMLAMLADVVNAARPELERLAEEAREDEQKLARKWGLTDEPGPASRLVAEIKARVLAVSVSPPLGFAGPSSSRDRLAVFQR